METIIKRLVTISLCFTLYGISIFAQTQSPHVNSNPDKAKFVTSDIDNFWRAFDLAMKESDRERRIAIFQAEYLDRGSPGLRDFLRLRIKSARDLVATIE